MDLATEEVPPAQQPAVAADTPAIEAESKPTENAERTNPPSEDAAAKQAPAEPDTPVADAEAREMAPSIADEEQSAPAVPDVQSSVNYLDMPAPKPVAPEPVVPSSADYSTQIWAGQGQNSTSGVSAKPSIASLASSAAWSSSNGNGNGGYGTMKWV